LELLENGSLEFLETIDLSGEESLPKADGHRVMINFG
jgi:hypothetical protein